jgi:triosephosphate isomerase
MARTIIVIGNWKMYKTSREASDYLEELFPLIEEAAAKVFLAVPYTSIAASAKAAKGTSVSIGAQNMNDAREGAFTGEIAALMLKEAGAEFVLIGHSERRTVFGETNEFIQRKVVRALQDDLMPVLCVGETVAARAAGKTEEVLREQIEECLKGVPAEEVGKIVLAYEPVWAIGTGKTATPDMAEEAHAFCRQCLGDLFGKKKADSISILYGGSVNEKNVTDLMAEANIDGVLVGGASLDPNTLASIALKAKKKTRTKKATHD